MNEGKTETNGKYQEYRIERRPKEELETKLKTRTNKTQRLTIQGQSRPPSSRSNSNLSSSIITSQTNSTFFSSSWHDFFLFPFLPCVLFVCSAVCFVCLLCLIALFV